MNAAGRCANRLLGRRTWRGRVATVAGAVGVAVLVTIAGVRLSIADADTAAALRAVDAATVAIFAFRDARGRPMAWPVTPYRDGDVVAVTSTLVFIQKAVHVRRDGRVALLAGGFHLTGEARVHPDLSGDEFAHRFLDQELRKYPPTRDLVRIPFHRYLFSWYFGRVIMEFTPLTVHERAGDTHCTLIALDARGFPVITPIAEPDVKARSFPLHPLPAGVSDAIADGSAAVLIHMEPSPTDLRQLILHGTVRSGVFSVRWQTGSLSPPPELGWWAMLQQQIEFHRRGREAKAIISGWSTAPPAAMSGTPH